MKTMGMMYHQRLGASRSICMGVLLVLLFLSHQRQAFEQGADHPDGEGIARAHGVHYPRDRLAGHHAMGTLGIAPVGAFGPQLDRHVLRALL
ncbi:hypothetical protein WR25_07303 [Diploscapter pachys]|uniref:Secreted protein n=1 Tax=Diploscapter pachys TaxID=2018661 RepID=A0A2A2K8L5_9BILA|nr:hypothetical protein WR25_07303 [Diploscapter pachys]